MSKYKAKKTIINGIQFASKFEAERYSTLLLLEKNGRIKDLKLQPRYELQPSFKKNNKTYRKIEYVADFEYYDTKENKKVIEDVKGYFTDIFSLKYKMFEYKYPNYELTIVRR